jgi:hypothetical protein
LRPLRDVSSSCLVSQEIANSMFNLYEVCTASSSPQVVFCSTQLGLQPFDFCPCISQVPSHMNNLVPGRSRLVEKKISSCMFRFHTIYVYTVICMVFRVCGTRCASLEVHYVTRVEAKCPGITGMLRGWARGTVRIVLLLTISRAIMTVANTLLVMTEWG